MFSSPDITLVNSLKTSSVTGQAEPKRGVHVEMYL